MFFGESKTLKELADSLRAIQKISSEQISAIRDAGQAAKEAQEDIEGAISTLQTPEADRIHARTYRKNNFIVQVTLAVGTWLAFIAAAIYAGIAARQASIMNQTYGQIQKQTMLMRQQMVGTQAATLVITLSFVPSGQLTVTLVITVSCRRLAFTFTVGPSDFVYLTAYALATRLLLMIHLQSLLLRTVKPLFGFYLGIHES